MTYQSQRGVFWYEEGDKWHHRNVDRDRDTTALTAMMGHDLPNQPTIVEVGCGSGFYISRLQYHYDATAYGLDVSDAAIKAARIDHPKVTFIRNSAHAVGGYKADLIVFGFCLYVIDRDQLFDVVSQADTALNPGGYLAIYDFDPLYPQKVTYHHCSGIFTYKMQYPALWLANPAYEFVSKTKTREGEAVTILRKGDWSKWQ